MARERMVTRTIISKEYTCKVYNLGNDEIENLVITMTGNDGFKGKDTLEKECNKKGNYRFLKVVKTEETEQLYAMTEVDFLKYAKPIEKGATKGPEE